VNPRAAPPPDDRLRAALSDRYAIDREIGAGGMATVFLASDVKHDRRVAVKVLRPELAQAMGGDRFPREIRTVAQFNHPHILSLYDSGEAQGYLYYVMPFVEGESLRERLAREGRLPVGDAVRILREVADALAYSHANGVVHRDIKPANVMLQGRHALVTDFGVAKALRAAGGDTVTTVGIAVGTPQYMAPEQAMGQETIDHRADLYALGVLGYEMLAGRPPFEGANAQALLAAQVLETPPDLATLRPGLPPALVQVVHHCLAKDPAERPVSAEAVLARLESIGATPSGGITPTDTRPVAAHRPVASRRTPVAAIAGLVALVLAVTAGWWWRSGNAAGDGVGKIGVLAIEDISGRDSLFAATMQDALINALVRAGGTDVAPRSAMLRYRGSAASAREIADDLGLGAIVEATVFRAGDVMRINVQLSDPVTSRALWSDSYERDVQDVLAAQSDVVARITSGIGAVIADPPTSRTR
jgi:eukaryotic-like serine/threonine-protein kinase